MFARHKVHMSNAQIHTWKRVLLLIKEYKKDITAIYFFAILSGIIQLSLPLGIQTIVGFSFGAQMVVSIYVLISLVVIGVFFVGLLNINQLKLIEKMQQKMFAKNSLELSEKLLKINLQGNDKYYLPEKVNRFFETFNIQKGISKLLIDIPIATIQIFLGLILLTLYDSSFIIFGIFLLAILWIILKYTSSLGLSTSMEESNDKYKVASWIEDIARVIHSFKFSVGSDLHIRKTDEYVCQYLIDRNKHFKILLFQYGALVAYKVLITLAMLGIGSYLLVEQKINIGEFVAAEIVILMVIGATEKLISNLDSLYDIATGLEKLEGLFEEESEKEGNIPWEPTDGGPEITLSNFHFKFKNNPFYVIKDSNFTIKRNTISTIYGHEGEGKTTLLKILGSLYRDYEGSLFLDRFEISNYTIESLRKRTGFYIRNQELFNGTIFDNISLGREGITIDSVIELIKKLEFQSIIHNLSKGLYTEIEPLGTKLSTSQIKKILLLRAFINDPKLLCLDEPFIALAENEKETIKSYLEEISKRTTIIVVSNEEAILACSHNKIQIVNNVVKVN